MVAVFNLTFETSFLTIRYFSGGVSKQTATKLNMTGGMQNAKWQKENETMSKIMVRIVWIDSIFRMSQRRPNVKSDAHPLSETKWVSTETQC